MGLEGPGRPGEEGAVLVGRIEKCVPGKKKRVRERQERGKAGLAEEAARAQLGLAARREWRTRIE